VTANNNIGGMQFSVDDKESLLKKLLVACQCDKMCASLFPEGAILLPAWQFTSSCKHSMAPLQHRLWV
jgi:hypothetical protein